MDDPSLLHTALACPDDGGALHEGPDRPRCRLCGREFGCEDGILLMPPAAPGWSAVEAAEVAAEQRQRDVEARHYDALPGLRLLSRWEVPATLGPLQVTDSDRVLEVGCGTGRLTLPLLERCGELVGVDHSLESLRVLRRKLPAGRGGVLLVHADATRLPVRSRWASRALSAQVLEHLPSPELRRRMVEELARALEPGGRFALSGYWHAPALRWVLPREGRHSGRIFFHRFTRGELRELLEPRLAVERLTGRLVYVLLAHGIKPRRSL